MHSTNPDLEPPPIVNLPDGTSLPLRGTFARSGLYDVATLSAFWTTLDYWEAWEVRWSPNLDHIVRLNEYGFRSITGVEFFDRNGYVRSYACSELMTGLRFDLCVPFTSANWHDVWYGDYDLDPSGRFVELSTVRRRGHFFAHTIDLGRQEFYKFDLATGNIVEQRVTGRLLVWLYLAALLAFPALCTTALRHSWRWLNARLSHTKPGFPVIQSPTASTSC